MRHGVYKVLVLFIKRMRKERYFGPTPGDAQMGVSRVRTYRQTWQRISAGRIDRTPSVVAILEKLNEDEVDVEVSELQLKPIN